MKIAKHLAGAALATLLISTPALAVDTSTVTFAQFTQNGNDKIAQYTNTGAGNALNITGTAAFFVVQDFGPPGVYNSTLTMSASSNQTPTAAGPIFRQGGWNGSIQFANGAANYLTTTFQDATFSFDSAGGSASLISTDPSSPITYTSNFLTLNNFVFKNFALAFTGLSPSFQLAQNGYGADFNANIAGSFAGAPDGPGGGAIPEPASWAMMIIGFGLTGATMRRRNMIRVVSN